MGNENNLENYSVLKQVLKEFYNINNEKGKNSDASKMLEGRIHIEPKVIYNRYINSLKLEIKIGDKQMYKIKSLPEFYDRFMNKEKFKYGSKLEFVHEKEQFAS